MVLAFAIFIVSSSATQDMSKLETRFEQAENFWFLGLSSRLRVRAPAGVPTRLPGPHRARRGLLRSFFLHGGHLLSPSFPAFRAERRIIRERKKAWEPHGYLGFFMELET